MLKASGNINQMKKILLLNDQAANGCEIKSEQNGIVEWIYIDQNRFGVAIRVEQYPRCKRNEAKSKKIIFSRALENNGRTF